MATAVDYLPGVDVLSEEEKKKILSVIRRDDELRREQDTKVNFIKQEVNTLRMKSVLRSGDDLSKMCARCHSQFSFFFNRGELCPKCSFRVCRLCKVQMLNGGWLCTLCYKSVQIKLTTGEWMRGMNTRRSIKRWASGSDLVKAALTSTPTDTERRRRKSEGGPPNDDEDELDDRHTCPHSRGSRSSHHGANPEDMKRPKESDKKRLSALVDSFKSQKKPEAVEKIMVRKVTSKRFSDSDASSSEDDSEITAEMHPVKTSSQRNSPIHSSNCNHSSIKSTGDSSIQPNSVLPGLHEHTRPDSRSTTVSYTESWRSSPEQSPASNRRFSTESSESQSSNAQTVLHMKRESGISTRSNSSASETSITIRDSQRPYPKTRRQGVLQPDIPEDRHNAFNKSLNDSVSPTPSRSSQGGKTRLLDMALASHRRQDSSGSEVPSSPGRTHSSGTDGEYTVEESSKIRFKRVSKQTVYKIQASRKTSQSSGLPMTPMDDFEKQQSRRKKVVIPEEVPPYDSSDSGNSDNDFNFTPKIVTNTNTFFPNHHLLPSLEIYCDSVVQMALLNSYRVLSQINSNNQSVLQKSFESPNSFDSPGTIYGKRNKKKSFRSRKIVYYAPSAGSMNISIPKETDNLDGTSLVDKSDSDVESSLESNFSISKLQLEVENYLVKNSNIRRLSDVSSESGYSCETSETDESKIIKADKITITAPCSESTSGLDNASPSISECSDVNNFIDRDKNSHVHKEVEDAEMHRLSLSSLSSLDHRLVNTSNTFTQPSSYICNQTISSPSDSNDKKDVSEKSKLSICDIESRSFKVSSTGTSDSENNPFPFANTLNTSCNSDILSPIEEVSEISSNSTSINTPDIASCSVSSTQNSTNQKSPFHKLRIFFENQSPLQKCRQKAGKDSSLSPTYIGANDSDVDIHELRNSTFCPLEDSHNTTSKDSPIIRSKDISYLEEVFQQMNLKENMLHLDCEIGELYEKNRNWLMSVLGIMNGKSVTDKELLDKIESVIINVRPVKSGVTNRLKHKRQKLYSNKTQQNLSKINNQGMEKRLHIHNSLPNISDDALPKINNHVMEKQSHLSNSLPNIFEDELPETKNQVLEKQSRLKNSATNIFEDEVSKNNFQGRQKHLYLNNSSPNISEDALPKINNPVMEKQSHLTNSLPNIFEDELPETKNQIPEMQSHLCSSITNISDDALPKINNRHMENLSHINNSLPNSSEDVLPKINNQCLEFKSLENDENLNRIKADEAESFHNNFVSDTCDEIQLYIEMTDSRISKEHHSLANSPVNMFSIEMEPIQDVRPSPHSNITDKCHPSYVAFGGQDYSRDGEVDIRKNISCDSDSGSESDMGITEKDHPICDGQVDSQDVTDISKDICCNEISSDDIDSELESDMGVAESCHPTCDGQVDLRLNDVTDILKESDVDDTNFTSQDTCEIEPESFVLELSEKEVSQFSSENCETSFSDNSKTISPVLSSKCDHSLNSDDNTPHFIPTPIHSLLVLCLKSLGNPRYMYSEPSHINGVVQHPLVLKHRTKCFKNNECYLTTHGTTLTVSNNKGHDLAQNVIELDFCERYDSDGPLCLLPLCLTALRSSIYTEPHSSDIIDHVISVIPDVQLSTCEQSLTDNTDKVESGSSEHMTEDTSLLPGDEKDSVLESEDKKSIGEKISKAIEMTAPDVLSKSQTSDDATSHGEDSGHASGLSQENTPEGRSPNILIHSVSFSDCDQEEEYDIDELVSRTRSLGSKGNLLSIGSDSKESLWSMYSNAGEGAFGNIPVTGDIQFGLSFNYKSDSLEINIIKCRNIAAVDVKRKRSDPYVKTYLLPDKTRSGKRKSKVKRHTLNPQFNEVLRYNITKSELENRTLWVSVWNNDRFGRNDFLGEVTIPLDYFKFENSSPQWYALESREDTLDSVGLAYKGDIIISLRYVTPDQIKTPTSASKKKNKKPNPNTEMGQLRVLIKEAKNLSAVRSNGTSDPFCKGYLLPEKQKSMKQKTPVVKKECNPLWNTTFIFEGVSHDELRERSLELTVWDHDRLSSNDFLGGLRLNLGSGYYRGKVVDWMDAHGEEISIWQAMIDRPNTWIDGGLPLRPSMDKRKS